MIYSRRLLYLLVVVFCCFQANAQWKEISPALPSANATSLGLYAEMPVSYFTGIPNISVPVFEAKDSKVGISIALSYHASGLRPEIHPGWVGNGWSLQAGGAITRIVNGSIDEYNRGHIPTVGYYFNHSQLAGSDWATKAASNQVVEFPNAQYSQQKADVDVEPDEFSFSFLGYSGKFFLDQNGQWRVQSDQNLKIIFDPKDFVNPFINNSAYSNTANIDNEDVSKTFGKFTIMDEKGNQYIFGIPNPNDAANPSNTNNSTAIEFSDIMIPQAGQRGASLTATSWFLSQIVSADGTEVVNFNYERGPFTSYIGYSYSASQTSAQTSLFGIFGSHDVSCTNTSSGRGVFSGRISSPVYLTSISMPNQDLEIDFTTSASNELSYTYSPSSAQAPSAALAYNQVYTDAGYNLSSGTPNDWPSFYVTAYTSPSLIPYFGRQAPDAQNMLNRIIWLKLDQVIIKNTALNTVLKTFTFIYNNNPQKRLQLNQLQVKDKTTAVVQSYNFAYNSTALPDYLTTCTDHWGFNNGTALFAGYSSNSLPDFMQTRAPDASGTLTQAEILTGITYPTGGVTSFVYEPNKYGSVIYRNSGVTPTAESGIAGGLRIRQINTNANGGPVMSKNYFYVNGYQPNASPETLLSSGVCDSKPVYNFNNTGINTENRSFTYQSFSSNPVIPLSANSMGTYIGYTQVVEQRSDGSYSIYQYTNHDNGYQDMPPVNAGYNATLMDFYKCTSLDFERGRLLSKTDYNSSGRPVFDQQTAYSNTVTFYSTNVPQLTANAVSTGQLSVCSTNNIGAISRVPYLLPYFPFVPVTHTTKTYDLSGSTSSSPLAVNDVYDQYKNLIQESTTNSDGTIHSNRYRYAYNFDDGSANNIYHIMVNQNMTSQVIEKLSTYTDNSGTEYVTGGEIHTYQLYGSQKLYNDAIYNYESLSPVKFSSGYVNTTYKGFAANNELAMDNHYVLRESLYYDDHGNPSSIQESGGHNTAFIWDYNRSKLVAKVDNASNVYSTGNAATNTAITKSLNVHVYGTLNSPIENKLVITRAGTVSLSFVYTNSSIPGNNSTTIEYVLIGSANTVGGSMCNSTPGGTSTCGATAASVTIPSVTPGTYTLRLTVRNMTGFQNYYGYDVAVSYPAYLYYSTSGNTTTAYTSFEYPTNSSLNFATGNWTGINASHVITGSTITGNQYYSLSGTSLTSPAIDPGQSYVVTYWSNNGPCTVSGSQSASTIMTLPSGWSQYQHLVTNSSLIIISGTANIDELRLYPWGSQMTTYTYTTAEGLTSSTDVKGLTTYYEYDPFQRLMNIRDQYGNIIKHYDYHYQNQTVYH